MEDLADVTRMEDLDAVMPAPGLGAEQATQVKLSALLLTKQVSHDQAPNCVDKGKADVDVAALAIVAGAVPNTGRLDVSLKPPPLPDVATGSMCCWESEAPEVPGLGVEQDTHLLSVLLLEIMHISHSHDPTAGANLAASPDRVLPVALEAEHATHALSLTALGTIHFSHSHEWEGGANVTVMGEELVGVTNLVPIEAELVRGANLTPRDAELVGVTNLGPPRELAAGTDLVSTEVEEGPLVIRPYSGDADTDDDMADGLGLRQAAHFAESGLLLTQHTPQVQEPAGCANSASDFMVPVLEWSSSTTPSADIFCWAGLKTSSMLTDLRGGKGFVGACTFGRGLASMVRPALASSGGAMTPMDVV